MKRLAKFLGVIALVTAIAAPSWAETLITPSTDDDNGVAVQAPNGTWGVSQIYGSGQAFAVFRETGQRDDPGPNGSLVFRINRYGGIGNTGGAHYACGLRGPTTDPNVPPGQCVWIQPYNDTVGEVISRSTSKDYQWMLDPATSEVVWKVANNGTAYGRRDVVARDGSATKAYIGNIFGTPGLALGQTSDAFIFRKAAGQLGISGPMFFPKVANPPTAQPGGVLAYSYVDGSGKLTFQLQFPTGAPVVVATEP